MAPLVRKLQSQTNPLTRGEGRVFGHANAATSSTTSVGGGSGAGTGPSGSLGGSTAPRPAPGSSGHSGTKFRHGLLQLMIHTIDPLHDGKL
ncbi:hypothetical protein RUM44_011266 [Polyplax serrata]|uniref:Uncharacterized protein n=1 Tax=Polyplax serrata TaxID=468196 RepID=A0ABR1AQ68_POLSC